MFEVWRFIFYTVYYLSGKVCTSVIVNHGALYQVFSRAQSSLILQYIFYDRATKQHFTHAHTVKDNANVVFCTFGSKYMQKLRVGTESKLWIGRTNIQVNLTSVINVCKRLQSKLWINVFMWSVCFVFNYI